MGFDLGAALGGALGEAVKIGGDIVGKKYESDLQGHAIDKQNQYNADASMEAWNRQIQENSKVFAQNVAQEERINEREKAEAQALYQQQKADALDLWNKQNEYNSPKAQMERFKAAGLNPRLIYDQGNPGNAVSITSPTISNAAGKVVEAESARADAVRSDVKPVPRYGDVLGDYMRIRQENLITKNLNIQNEILKEKLRGDKNRYNYENYEWNTLRNAGVTRYDDTRLRLGGRVLDIIGDSVRPRPMMMDVKEMPDYIKKTKPLTYDDIVSNMN